ncbi:hypothetical protein ACA910_003903 [Epithemia clementina (nom. ined.)]
MKHLLLLFLLVALALFPHLFNGFVIVEFGPLVSHKPTQRSRLAAGTIGLSPFFHNFVSKTTLSDAATSIDQAEMDEGGGSKQKEPFPNSSHGTLLPVQTVSTMPEPLQPDDLKNMYYLLRHGQSTANVASIISSDRSLAYTDKHGLTATGYEQGRESAHNLLELLRDTAQPGDEVIFVSSPFARARQTAQACLEELLVLLKPGNDPGDDKQNLNGLSIHDKVALNDGLVERYFGRLDGEAIYTYAYVWPLDKINVTHTTFDVESVAAVCTRIRETILQLEQHHYNSETANEHNQGPPTGRKHILLVSHADTLQIAKLYAAEPDNVGHFSSYRFKNGEVRRMIVGSSDHFPPAVPLEGPKRCTKERLKELRQPQQ